jgi:hypothetical protein
VSAPKSCSAALLFAANAWIGVLVVFELDHGVILLEPFRMMHKANFARYQVFTGSMMATLTPSRPECGSAT